MRGATSIPSFVFKLWCLIKHGDNTTLTFTYTMGTGDSICRIKRPGLETDRSPPSSSVVTNAWSYTSTLAFVFKAWYLVKHKDNFTFHRR
jgi:hypothetical protein